MKNFAVLSVVFVVVFTGCQSILQGCLPVVQTAKSSNTPNSCNPPEEWPGHELTDCTKQGEKTCCGYGFLLDHKTLCFDVVCQTSPCMEWKYYTSFCPVPEGPTDQTLNYDAQEDEGWEDDA